MGYNRPRFGGVITQGGVMPRPVVQCVALGRRDDDEQQDGASPEAVKAASRSHDNRLTVDEYVNVLFKDFAAADTDADGKLTIEEIDVYIRTNRR
jgi:hypothetical protein